MKKNEKLSWEADFVEFVSTELVDVPQSVERETLSAIARELRPSSLSVFGKVLAIHVVVGLITLSYCPQFGVGLTSGMGLMPFLMKFGESVCMLGCGALFLSFSLLAASLLLRTEEVRILKQNIVLQILSLSVLSIGTLLVAGAEVAAILALVWTGGALVGGVLSLEAGWTLRKYLLQRAAV